MYVVNVNVAFRLRFRMQRKEHFVLIGGDGRSVRFSLGNGASVGVTVTVTAALPAVVLVSGLIVVAFHLSRRHTPRPLFPSGGEATQKHFPEIDHDGWGWFGKGIYQFVFLLALWLFLLFVSRFGCYYRRRRRFPGSRIILRKTPRPDIGIVSSVHGFLDGASSIFGSTTRRSVELLLVSQDPPQSQGGGVRRPMIHIGVCVSATLSLLPPLCCSYN